MIILSHILSINWDNDANSPTTVKSEKLTEKSKHISHGCSVLVALCDFLYMSFGDSPLIKKVKQQLSDLIPKCKTLRDISISQPLNPEPLLVSQTEIESSDYPARKTCKWSVCMCYKEQRRYKKNYCILTIKDVDHTSENPRFRALLEF